MLSNVFRLLIQGFLLEIAANTLLLNFLLVFLWMLLHAMGMWLALKKRMKRSKPQCSKIKMLKSFILFLITVLFLITSNRLWEV